MNGERDCRLELFMREYMERKGSAYNGAKISYKRDRSKVPCKRNQKYDVLDVDNRLSKCFLKFTILFLIEIVYKITPVMHLTLTSRDTAIFSRKGRN